jgi:ketosteroid isomerase-like protein
VSRLVSGRLDQDQREQQLDRLAALYAEQTDVRHPFASAIAPLRTRAEVRAHFANAPGRNGEIERFGPAGLQVHRTEDPEIVITEFHYQGETAGRPFSVPNIFVTRVRDGQIVESRDYADHAAFARAGLSVSA